MQLNLKKEDVEKIHTVKAILEKEYRRHYTNEQLAQKVNTNAFKLKCGFKQIFNKSIYANLTEIRIEKAKELLVCSDDSVKKISFVTGFKNQSSFIRSFRRSTGVSPLVWKRDQKLQSATTNDIESGRIR